MVKLVRLKITKVSKSTKTFETELLQNNTSNLYPAVVTPWTATLC